LDAVFCAYQNANKCVLLIINNYHYIKLRTFRLFFKLFSKNVKI